MREDHLLSLKCFHLKGLTLLSKKLVRHSGLLTPIISLRALRCPPDSGAGAPRSDCCNCSGVEDPQAGPGTSLQDLETWCKAGQGRQGGVRVQRELGGDTVPGRGASYEWQRLCLPSKAERVPGCGSARWSGWKGAIPAPRALFPKGQTRLVRCLSRSLQNRNAFSECCPTRFKERSFLPLALYMSPKRFGEDSQPRVSY